MVAQIRTGLWVRNGFAIRGQLIHYRDYMLRELCYDQDLFILRERTSLGSMPYSTQHRCLMTFDRQQSGRFMLGVAPRNTARRVQHANSEHVNLQINKRSGTYAR